MDGSAHSSWALSHLKETLYSLWDVCLLNNKNLDLLRIHLNAPVHTDKHMHACTLLLVCICLCVAKVVRWTWFQWPLEESSEIFVRLTRTLHGDVKWELHLLYFFFSTSPGLHLLSAMFQQCPVPRTTTDKIRTYTNRWQKRDHSAYLKTNIATVAFGRSLLFSKGVASISTCFPPSATLA